LAFLGELDWEAMLDQLESRAIPGVESVEGSTYWRTIVVDGYPGAFELWRGGPDYVVLCAHLPRWDELVHIVQRARDIANLDLPLEEAQDASLRPAGTWDGFEAGVHAILAENATPAHAARLAGRIVDRFGARVPGLERLGLTHTFPAAAT